MNLAGRHEHLDSFRLMYETSPTGMALLSLAGEWIHVNDAVSRITGYPREDLLRTDFQSITHPDDLAADLELIGQVLAGERTHYQLQKRFVRPDGSAVWMLFNVSLMRDGDGRPDCLLSQIIDVDESVRAELQHRALLESIVELQGEIARAARGDQDDVLALVADRLLDLIAPGLSDGAAVELLTADDPPMLEFRAASGTLAANLGRQLEIGHSLSGVALSTGTVALSDDTEVDDRVDRQLTRRTGVRAMLIAPVSDGGEAFGVLGVSSRQPHAFTPVDAQLLTVLANSLAATLRQARDTTHIRDLLRQSHDANAALRASEERFRLAFWHGPLGMAVADTEPRDPERRREINPALAAIMGYAPDEIERIPDGRNVVEEDRPGYLAALRRLKSGADEQASLAVRCHRRNGEIADINLHVALARDDDGHPRTLISLVEDITAQRAAERALTERARLLELARDAVIVRDPGNRIEYWNPAAERIFGWPAAAVLGTDIDQLLRTRWPVGVTASSVHDTLLVSGSWEGEVEYARSDGRRVAVQIRQALQRDEHGAPTAVLSIATDVTERRAAERARDEAARALIERNTELERANQLKTDLIGMLGHEINNPLSVIAGVTEIATDDAASGIEAGPDYVELVHRNVQRLQRTVREVLSLVTVESGSLIARPAAVAVAPLLGGLMESMTLSVPIVGRADAGAWAQPEHVEQIVANLLSNAAKYAGGAARLEVRTNGTCLEIDVVDHGSGIPPEFRSRLFERFSRADGAAERARGTGLGLYIVRELARANSGEVRHLTNAAGGSTFRVSLPAHSG